MKKHCVMEDPSEMAELFVEYWNKKDAKELSGLFAEDADFINVVGLWWSSREAIFKAHEYGFRTIFPNSTLMLMKSKVRMLGDQHAIVHARFRLSGQSAPKNVQEDLGVRKNVFTFVLSKNKDGWICLSAQNTDIVPNQETHINRNGRLSTADYR